MTTAAGSTTTKMPETNENFNMKQCLNDLTKIPQKEFEAQFRNWMEKDGVARAMQAKLRADLFANFNKTNLGKHIIGQMPIKRLTLSPMEMALNTLVAEFLFVQNCHFSLSVYSTEAPFRNTLPDFECVTHFRFKDNEVTEIVSALGGSPNFDCQICKEIIKNYVKNKSTSLLHHILKVLLERKANAKQQKINIGTNTKSYKLTKHSTELTSSPMSERSTTEAEFYNTSFELLNRYITALSQKVQDMRQQIEHKTCKSCAGQPRIRVHKSSNSAKFKDLNGSVERITESFKQMSHKKVKSKSISSVIKAIEDLALQFKKCAENFEQFESFEGGSDMANAKVGTSSSAPTTCNVSSQTEICFEKSFTDWLQEMRYTRNGQKFLDRIERSFFKALQKQKRELLAENEIKLRHEKELIRIRYKQKVLQEICGHSNQSARVNDTANSNAQSNETVGEQFRQFELKHIDLLNKLYETDHEHRVGDGNSLQQTPKRCCSTTEKLVQFNVQEQQSSGTTNFEFGSSDTKLSTSNESVPTAEPTLEALKEKCLNDYRQTVKTAIGEIIEEERSVDRIVSDAKLRIRELEQESNQLTENFLGYLERQREQKLAAREAAQNLWSDYMSEREKMQQRYLPTSSTAATGDAKAKSEDFREALKKFLIETNLANKTSRSVLEQQRENSSFERKESSIETNSSSCMEFKNPITEAKDNLFERERILKAEYAKKIFEDSGNAKPDFYKNLKLEERYCEDGGPGTSASPTNDWLTKFMKESLCSVNSEGKQHEIETASSTTQAQLVEEGAEIANGQSSLERPQNDFASSTRCDIIAKAKEAMRNQQRMRALTTNAILAAAATAKSTIATKPITTTATATSIVATISRTLNKNKADSGASAVNEGATAQQDHSTNNHKIKSDAGNGQKQTTQTTGQQKSLQQQQLQQRQQERRNETSNIDLNDSFEVPLNGGEMAASSQTAMSTTTISFGQTSKPPISMAKLKVNSGGGGSGSNATELSRKAVLKETMARMQQLFSPHHRQQQLQHQHQHQKQHIILPDVGEEQTQQQQLAKSEMEKFQKVEKTQLSSLTSSTSKDTANTNAARVFLIVDGKDCEGILSSAGCSQHNTNDSQLKQQNNFKGTSKDRQQEQIAKIPTSVRNLSAWSVGVAATITTAALANSNKTKTTSTPLHSIDEGNKTVEASVDWQQIACGPSGRQNETKVNADDEQMYSSENGKAKTVKEKANDDKVHQFAHANDADDDCDDEDEEDYLKKFTKVLDADAINLTYEAGEIIESIDLPEGNLSPTKARASNKAHSGGYAGGDGADNSHRTTLASTEESISTSEVSSIDYRLSADSIPANVPSYSRVRRPFNKSKSDENVADNVSDSGSDFWA